MNENEMKMHEELFNLYMDLGYGVVDSFTAATDDIRRQQRIDRSYYAPAGIWQV
jgi:hypothetical protein